MTSAGRFGKSAETDHRRGSTRGREAGSWPPNTDRSSRPIPADSVRRGWTISDAESRQPVRPSWGGSTQNIIPGTSATATHSTGQAASTAGAAPDHPSRVTVSPMSIPRAKSPLTRPTRTVTRSAVLSHAQSSGAGGGASPSETIHRAGQPSAATSDISASAA